MIATACLFCGADTPSPYHILCCACYDVGQRAGSANPTEAKHQSKPGGVEAWSVGLSQPQALSPSSAHAPSLGCDTSGACAPTEVER